MNKIQHFFRTYLTPQESNDHKPHILREYAASVVLALVLIGEIAFLSHVFLVIPNSASLAQVLSSSLVDFTNVSRKDKSLTTLQTNVLLTQAATAKAQDMSVKGYFAHTSPQGVTPWYWIQQSGYKYQYAGENLAVNFFDSKDVLNAWLNSPLHRANILNKDFTEIGIGTAEGYYKGNKAIFVVQYFGKPFGGVTGATNISGQGNLNTSANLNNANPANNVRRSFRLSNQTNVFSALASSPRQVANAIYGFICGILILVLGLIVIKSGNNSERRDKKVITRGLLLIGVIIVLVIFNDQIMNYFGTII